MTFEQSTLHDLGPKTVDLYACDGKVTPIREFTAANLGLLAYHEADLVEGELGFLADPDDIPEVFRKCMSRSREIATVPVPVMTAERSGARSAFVLATSLQLKGCRPMINGETFPTEILHSGSLRITRSRIPFGVMTTEAVLREVLGYCFMRKHDLPLQATPLAVTTYCYGNRSLGHSMLLKLKSEDRIESHLEDPQCSVREVINLQTGTGDTSSRPDCIVGSELRLKGVNVWKYVEAKGRILTAMHWRGGFRGILNSNIGNDVLICEGNELQKLALADFDTFSILPVLADATRESLDSFVLHCLLEVVIGSLPIVQYVDLPADSPFELRADALGAVYFTKSSLWRTYYRHFLAEATAFGCDVPAVVESIERMRRTEAFADILSSRVLSGESVKRAETDRIFHFSHN
jgi:hypothetical protein